MICIHSPYFLTYPNLSTALFLEFTNPYVQYRMSRYTIDGGGSKSNK